MEQETIGEILVIGRPIEIMAIQGTEEQYYTEPAGIRSIGSKVGQATMSTLKQVINRVVGEVEECAQGKEWAAELTVEIGLGPQPACVTGQLAITISSKGASQ